MYYQEFNFRYKGGGYSNNGRQVAYARQYLSLVKPLFVKQRDCFLLDVGPSTNPFPNLAVTSGFHVTVLDFVRPQTLHENIKFIASSIDGDRIDGLSDAFDVVTAFAVLEHCLSPRMAAHNMVSLCKPGGYIVLTTPAVGRFGDRFGLGRSPWFYPPEHLNLISPLALRQVFESAGAQLLQHGMFEISTLRRVIRSGAAFCEGIAGLLFRYLMPYLWTYLRSTRRTFAQEIHFFILQKHVLRSR